MPQILDFSDKKSSNIPVNHTYEINNKNAYGIYGVVLYIAWPHKLTDGTCGICMYRVDINP